MFGSGCPVTIPVQVVEVGEEMDSINRNYGT